MTKKKRVYKSSDGVSEYHDIKRQIKIIDLKIRELVAEKIELEQELSYYGSKNDT